MLTALNSGKIDLTEIGNVGAIQSYANGGKVRRSRSPSPTTGTSG